MTGATTPGIDKSNVILPLESSTNSWMLLVDMNHLGGGEAVEPGGGGVAVGANGFAINQVVQLQIGQILGQRDGVQGVAGLAEDGADFGRAALEGFEVVLAMIEDDAREGVVNPVVNVIAGLAVAAGLADDLGDGGGGGSDHEAARFGDEVGVLGKEAVRSRR